ncbi:MAG: CotH kinase family protein [Bacteroidota bacterium]|nr:CotH kinase family protein [Bacteroidota bacterium]
MKKTIITLAIGFVLFQISFAKPSFLKSKYLIACLANGSTGTVSPGNATYPLVFYPDQDSETANDSSYWAIKDLGNGKYAFQNKETLKYIKYNSALVDRTALVLVDELQSDESTSFTLELKVVNNLNYYVIRSVSNPLKIWNKRATSYGGLYPVGTYSVTGADLEYFLFYDKDGDPVQDDAVTSVTMPTAKPNLGAFSTLLDTLSFNGKVPVVDTSNKRFYISVTESQLGTNVTMPVYYKVKNAGDLLYLNGTAVESGASYTFNSLTGASYASIQIRNGSTTKAFGAIFFSSLPLVQLYSDATLTATYTLGRIVVTEPDKPVPSETLLSNLKTRGAYASMLDKKAFSIKLKARDGLTSLDRSFFGLRSDNNWILDAMGIDLARMRNRVTTDLWNEYAVKPYYSAQEPTMVNGTRGHYVEVFVNDSYNGLYCMTEKVDRKQLKLKKVKVATSTTAAIQHGALYKADDWSFESVMGNPLYLPGTNGIVSSYNNTSETWCRYAVKYPDLGDGEPIEWKPLHDAVYFTSNSTPNSTFSANVANYFDIPVVRDYYLLLDLILAADNHGKNLFFSIYDQAVSNKLSITPWDLDATWGRRWDGSSNVTFPNQSWDAYVAAKEFGNSNLFIRLKQLNAAGFNDLLKARYKELRGGYFSYSSLMGRFQNYQTMLKNSGAMYREINRWYGNRVAPDDNFDLSYLSSWITARLAYLDKQYLGGPYLAVNETSVPEIHISPNPVRDLLTISNISSDIRVDIYSVQGNLVYSAVSDGEHLTVDMSKYPSGIYLIKVADKVEKVIKQ